MKELIIKRIDKELPLPQYKTGGSVGMDLVARKDVTFKGLTMELVPLNIVIKTPEKYATLLLPRSSLFRKKGLIMANSVGVIDQDYCGDEDEVKACLLFMANINKPAQTIKRGEIVCQLLLTRVDNDFEVVESDSMGDSRGGFGSTGGYADNE